MLNKLRKTMRFTDHNYKLSTVKNELSDFNNENIGINFKDILIYSVMYMFSFIIKCLYYIARQHTPYKYELYLPCMCIYLYIIY